MLKDAGKREDLNKNLAATSVPANVTIQLQQEPMPQTVPLHERTATDWYEEAKNAFEAKDFEKALGLVHYCIRMDADKADHHVLLAKVLDIGGGDKKALVRALETAIRLNPKDVDSTIRLAEVFQTVGMYARATKLWETARYLAPNHRHFIQEQRQASAKAKAAEQIQGMGEQFAVLKEQGKALINRWLKKG
jgi:tetratricopeptide (TPR) repeat protein